MKSILAFLLLLTTLCMAKDKTTIISSLKENDSISVTFFSSGCVHHSRETYIFKNSMVTIKETELKYLPEKGEYEDVKSNTIGPFLLKADFKTKFDNLFDYYKNVKPGNVGCYEIDTVKIEYYSSNILNDTENIVDSTCGKFTDEKFISLAKLKAQLIKENESKEKK